LLTSNAPLHIGKRTPSGTPALNGRLWMRITTRVLRYRCQKRLPAQDASPPSKPPNHDDLSCSPRDPP